MQSSASAGPSWAEWIRAAAAIIVITAASTVVMGTLPLLNGLFAEQLRLDWRDLGWLGTAAQSGTLLGTLLGYWLIGRGVLQGGLRFGAFCAAIAWLFAATAATFGSLLAARLVTSIGLGCVFSIGTYAIAHTAHPARGFSVMGGMQVALGSVHAALLPTLRTHFGYTIAVASIVVWFVFVLVLTRWFSKAGLSAQPTELGSATGVSPTRSSFAGAELLLSVLAFHMAAVTFWGYSERIAMSAGLSQQEIAGAVSLGSLGGIPASILGALVADRFGYVPLLLLATLAAASGEFAMANSHSVVPYFIGQFVFNFGWMLGVSYYLALLPRRAVDARVIRAAPIALVLAGILGPLSIALFSGRDNSTLLLSLSLALGCVAIIPVLIRRA